MRAVAMALVGYVAVALAMTWPLAADLATRLPYDLGDPLLNCWILAWQVRQFSRLLHGDLTVLGEWWHGNIFHPAPYTLGLSEGLIVPSLMGWPVLALTGNVILTYNLLFLATFVLSGLGAFLWVRELTRHTGAAWVAGLLFAVAPFRFEHGSHLQAQFACWMPFVLWQVERLVTRGGWRHVAGVGASLAALNLSNGYYMFFFAPWVPAYAGLALWRHDRWRHPRVWRDLVVAAAVALGLTLPAMVPYLALRGGGGAARSLAEIERYSATWTSWVTASPWLRLWRAWLPVDGNPEVHLFPGAFPLLAVLVAVVLWRRLATRDRRLVLAAMVACVIGVGWSFGPLVEVAGRRLPSLYLALYHYVPGFDTLRVPARVATVVALWTSALAGLVVATASGAWPATRAGLAATALAAVTVVVLADAWVAPMRMHDVLHAPHFRQQSPHLDPRPADAPLTRALARLPEDAVLVHLPFGPLSLEVRYMYASIGHWRRLVNGYSGAFPPSYLAWRRDLERLPDGGPEAERALRESGATHVVLHEEYFGSDRTAKLDGWLTSLGAVRVARPGTQIVYKLPLTTEVATVSLSTAVAAARGPLRRVWGPCSPRAEPT